jgi:hypothetical protein
MFHDTVPVILADPVIEPFERFLDWRQFTVKYLTSGMDNTKSSAESRVKSGYEMIVELSLFSQSLRKCGRLSSGLSLDSSGAAKSNIGASSSSSSGRRLRHSNSSSSSGSGGGGATTRATFSSNPCAAFKRKVQAMRAVMPWLGFEDPNEQPKRLRSAYKLLLLELWCRSPKGTLA